MPLTANPTVAHAQAADDQGQAVPVPPDDEYADTDPSALTDFRQALDPYGTWVDDGTYGTSWTPNQDEVGADFVPYDSDGQWDYVDGDYLWVSGFAWGWVCFHYGRWAYSAGRWLWIPGRTYAPAWVDWRFGNDDPTYLGWAPTAPAWEWSGGSAVALGFLASEPWMFAHGADLFGPGLSTRVVTGRAAATVVSNSRPYVRAHPSVAGHVVIQPVMHGPPASMLGIDPAQVPQARLGAREQRARQLARPSTAMPLGAHAPAPHVIRYSGQHRGLGAPVRSAVSRGRR